MKTKILIFLAMIFMANSVYGISTDEAVNKYKKKECGVIVDIAEEAVQMSASGIPMEDYLYRYSKKFPDLSSDATGLLRKVVLASYKGQKSGRGVLGKIYNSCYNGEEFAPLQVQRTIMNYKKNVSKNKIAVQ